MDPQRLLEQFFGAGAGQKAADAAKSAKENLADGDLRSLAGGLASGGLLGLLVGNKKMRKKVGKLAGGVVGYGGAAALGALGYRAYQNWQANKPAEASSAPVASHSTTSALPIAPPPEGSKFLAQTAPAKDGQPFELALIAAMIAAANADGHIGPEEQRTIFSHVNQLPLDAEDKAFVFDTLSNPPSLQDIANKAEGIEQAAELYLASRLAIDPDHPAEQAYLEALAGRLSLPADLVAHLEDQARLQT